MRKLKNLLLGLALTFGILFAVPVQESFAKMSDTEYALSSERPISEEVKKEKKSSRIKQSIQAFKAVKAMKKASPNGTMDDMVILLVILCFFIPPLAVYIKSEDIKKTLIDLLLCLLLWIPGIVYALLVVLDVI